MDLANAINNLACLLQDQGQLDEAEALQKRALAMDEANLGTDDPSVAINLGNLGRTLHLKNRLEEAEFCYRRAIEIDERTLGDSYRQTARHLYLLADLLVSAGKLSDAEPILRRSLAIYEKCYGANHPIASQVRNLLEISLVERRLGRGHPDTLQSWEEYSCALRRLGHFASAEAIDRRVAATTANVFSDTSSLAIYRRNTLVITLILLGKLEEARQILAANWRLTAPPYANTTPRIAFLRQLIALLESQPDRPFLGQIKTLLTGPELPVARDVAVPWDIAYFIEFLKSKLGEHVAEFLTALVAALNDRAKLSALDPFPEWRDQSPIPLDVPWSE